MKPILVRVLCGGLVLFLFWGWLGDSLLWTAGVHLLSGWLAYLLSVLPHVRVRWDGILFFAIGYGLSIVLAHWWLSWFIASSGTRVPSEVEAVVDAPSRPWRWRHSFSVVTLFLTMFFIVVAMAGVTHQVGWLATSPTRWQVSAVQSASDNQLSRYRLGQVDPNSPSMNWIASILPFIHYMYPEVDSTLPWNDPKNAKAYQTVIPELFNPRASLPQKSPDGFGLNHFAGNEQVLGSPKPVKLNDWQVAGTLLIGEVNQGLEPWAMPGNCRNPTVGISPPQRIKPGTQLGFGSPSRTRTTAFAQLDGSVIYLSDKVDPDVLKQLSQLKPLDKP